jgi:putative ABC transport system permease protein
MLRLLALVSRRELAARPYRVALFVCAVAVGIAMVTAMRVATDRIVAGYSDRLLQLAGRSDLQVTLGTGEAGFDESLLERIKATPGVAAAGAIVRGALSFEDGEVLELYGIDLLDDDIRALYDFEVVERETDDFTIVNDPYAVFLPEEIAARRGLRLNDKVALVSSVGTELFTVRGIIRPPAVAQLYGGRIAAMYLPAAQAITGRRGSLHYSLIDQVDLTLARGVPALTVEAALRASLGSSFSVGPPAQRRAASEHTVIGLRSTLIGMSSVALLAAMFIVYATTAGLVIARSPQAATLLSVGADRRTIVGMTILEATVLGFVGACAGVVAGFFLAGFVVADVADGMSLNYSMDFGGSAGPATGSSFLAILLQHGLLGAVAAGVSAAIPARALRFLDPIEIRSQRVSTAGRLAENSVALRIGVAVICLAGAGGLAWGVGVQSALATAAGGVLTTFGFVLAALPVLRLLVGRAAAVLARRGGIAGRIAGEELQRSWGHIATTVAAIGLCIAVASAAGSLARSFRSSVASWYGFSGDALVLARRSEGGWLPAALPLSTAERIARAQGVSAIETLRVSHGRLFRGERIAWAAASAGFLTAAMDASRHPRCEDCVGARGRILSGEAVAVSRNFAHRFGIGLGDTIDLGRPSGSPFAVVAVVDDYVSDKGSLLIERDAYVELSHDERANFIGIWLEEGHSVEALRAELAADSAAFSNVTVISTGEMMDRVSGMIGQAFADVDTIQLLVVFITLAAIINLFFASVMERRSEFALLRIVGADQSTVRNATVLEALVIAASAAALGILAGAVAAWTWIHFCYPVLVGYVLDLDFAWSTAVVCFGLAVASAVGAGWAASGTGMRSASLVETARVE